MWCSASIPLLFRRQEEIGVSFVTLPLSICPQGNLYFSRPLHTIF